MDEYLTAKQLSKLIQVPEKTLAQYRCNKKIKIPYCKIGNHVRYVLSEVQEFIKNSKK